MSDLKLFQINGGRAAELQGEAVALERSLQTLMENNLEAFLGVRFLESEYSTGPKHGGRIDSLGIDENGNPVIVEYKRATNENVINQGLFYLDWLLDHQADFELLVQRKLGREAAADIDWSAPRLVCVAGNFTRYDEHAVKQMNRNIELIRYRKFGDGLLLLELVNAATASGATAPKAAAATSGASKTISQTLAELDGSLRDLYEELRAFVLALGDDVQEKTLKYYVAFKRLKNFACVEVHPGKGCVTAYVKADPGAMPLEAGFTRDVRDVGHYGTGDLEIILRTRTDLERAQDLIRGSYEAN
ncbi:MAG TPA: DUF5655 domain-containing protein [Actinomycetota bacterium]